MKADTKTLKEYAKESCKKPIWKGIDTLLLTKENVELPAVRSLVEYIINAPDGPYSRHFPNPAEREKAEDIMARIKEDKSPKLYLTFSFKDLDKAGEDANNIKNLIDSNNPEDLKKIEQYNKNINENFCGLCEILDYKKTGSALGAYLIRSKEAREYPAQQMSAHLLEIIAQDKYNNDEKFVTVLIECEDPRKPENDFLKQNSLGVWEPDPYKVMSANTRTGVFEKDGAKALNFTYVQPRIQTDSTTCQDFVFLAVPANGMTDIEVAKSVKKFINEYYRALPDEEKFSKEGGDNVDYVAKYLDYCSKGLNNIENILKENKPGSKELPLDDQAKKFIEDTLLPKARTLSWDSWNPDREENFADIKNLITSKNEYKTPEIRAQIFRETLESLKEELTQDSKAVNKMVTELDQIIRGERDLYCKKLFSEEKYELESQRLKEFYGDSKTTVKSETLTAERERNLELFNATKVALHDKVQENNRDSSKPSSSNSESRSGPSTTPQKSKADELQTGAESVKKGSGNDGR